MAWAGSRNTPGCGALPGGFGTAVGAQPGAAGMPSGAGTCRLGIRRCMIAASNHRSRLSPSRLPMARPAATPRIGMTAPTAAGSGACSAHSVFHSQYATIPATARIATCRAVKP